MINFINLSLLTLHNHLSMSLYVSLQGLIYAYIKHGRDNMST